MLVWYSQEARGYSLLVLLRRASRCSTSCGRWTAAAARDIARLGGRRRRSRSRPTTSRSSRSSSRPPGCCGGAAARPPPGSRSSSRPASPWRRWRSTRRCRDTRIGSATTASATGSGRSAVTFAVGETGEVIAQPERLTPAIVPLAAMRRRPRAARVRAASAASAAPRRRCSRSPPSRSRAPLAIAVLHPAADFVLARNLIPALVPLLVAVAIATTLRRARRAGIAVAAVLLAYSLGFTVLGRHSPSLQRVDWESVADRLGEPQAPRAMVTWTLGAGLAALLPLDRLVPGQGVGRIPLVRARNRLHLRRRRRRRSRGGCSGPASPRPGTNPSAALRIRRYALRARTSPACGCAGSSEPTLNFGSNGVLLDGIGPG